MDYSEDEEYIIKLAAEFLDSVAEGDASEFELDDLLDIYDYACDTGNEYLRLQVLFVAHKRWPNSVDLNERIAFGIYSRGDYDGARATLDLVPDDSRMKQMLLASMSHGSDEEKMKLLDDVLDGVNEEMKLTDEEVIRLVEIVDMHKLYEWAEKNFDRLKEISEYPDTLMNELAEILPRHEYTEFRKRLLEDFVKDYPLLYQSWWKLADFYKEEGYDSDYVENAVNNALAIDPENYDLRVNLAELMLRNSVEVEKTRDFINELYEDNPDREEAIVAKALMLSTVAVGKTEEGISVLKRGLREIPDSVIIMMRLLFITDGRGVEEEMELFAKNFRPFLDDAAEIVDEYKRLVEWKSFGAAARAGILVKKFRKGDDPYYFDDKIGEDLYRNGEYDEIVKRYSSLSDDILNWPDGLILVYLLSLKKTGGKELCAKLVDYLLECIMKGMKSEHGTSKLEEDLKLRGLIGCLTFMQRLFAGEEIDERLYNPFIE